MSLITLVMLRLPEISVNLEGSFHSRVSQLVFNSLLSNYLVHEQYRKSGRNVKKKGSRLRAGLLAPVQFADNISDNFFSVEELALIKALSDYWFDYFHSLPLNSLPPMILSLTKA
jgi:hypothetical protein